MRELSQRAALLLVSVAFCLAACGSGAPPDVAARQVRPDPGAEIFGAIWGAEETAEHPFGGLGPVYSRASCAGCHTRGGRGRPPQSPDHPMLTMAVLLGQVDADGAFGPHPAYGRELNPLAVPGVPREGAASLRFEAEPGRYGDGTPYVLWRSTLVLTDLAFGPLGENAMISPRIAQPLFGSGLLDHVPDAAILANADPEDSDGDGISGRVNRVAGDRTDNAIGRFGWKAGHATLRRQNAAALHGDMGVTTPIFPAPNCPPIQRACRMTAHTGAGPNASAGMLDDVTVFVAGLKPPMPTADASLGRGSTLFAAIGCDGCHLPSLSDGAGGRIHAYTDLLLHDMGPDLADGFREGRADGREWRTQPLWGIGAHERGGATAYYLHDGRARTLDQAILWHGGEAAAARNRFRMLSAADRAALIDFLKSL